MMKVTPTEWMMKQGPDADTGEFPYLFQSEKKREKPGSLAQAVSAVCCFPF
jgi:hypothetical protein